MQAEPKFKKGDVVIMNMDDSDYVIERVYKCMDTGKFCYAIIENCNSYPESYTVEEEDIAAPYEPEEEENYVQ